MYKKIICKYRISCTFYIIIVFVQTLSIVNIKGWLSRYLGLITGGAQPFFPASLFQIYFLLFQGKWLTLHEN